MAVKLGDVQTSEKKEAGNRYIARVAQPVNSELSKKIQRGVDKFTGEHCRTMVLDCTAIEMCLFWHEKPPLCICGPMFVEQIDSGTINLNCSKIDVEGLVSATVSFRTNQPRIQHHGIARLKEWLGKDVEITTIPWRY